MKLINLADAVRAVRLNTGLTETEKFKFRNILQFLPTADITYCKDCVHRTHGRCPELVPGHLVTTAEHFHCAYGKER
ncbi:MAG: hypothetical protein J6B95_08290 [Oscillospiraceae bacterium]|nr:hypothetical protein [Oscillospiraceae bacterium]